MARARTRSRSQGGVKKLSRPLWERSRFNPGVVVLLIGLVVGVAYAVVREGRADSCTVSAILVNSCRPWLGSRVKGYPQAASDDKSQVLYEESSIAGRQNDIAHTFHPVGDNQLSSYDKYLATRPGGYLLTNWKPTNNWANISQDNAAIDSMANSIKSIAPQKIFLALHHEPQNDVTSDPNCPNLGYVGSAGTPTDYRNMWAYVHNRFAQDGVNNVVWVLIYQGYKKWDCLIPDLYPGNSLVDWIGMDDYGTTQNPNFITNTQRVYDLLTADSDTTHDFLSKPWALTEWNFCGGTSAEGVTYYNEAKQAVDSGNFPRIHAWVMFDALGTGVTQIPGCLLAYDSDGTYDNSRVSAYRAYANDANFKDPASTPTPTPSTPTPTPTPTSVPTSTPPATPVPTPTPVSDSGGSGGGPVPTPVVLPPSGSVDVGGTVALEVPGAAPGPAEVSVDGQQVSSDGQIDTTYLTNGEHSVTVTTSDGAGHKITQTATIEVHNHLNLWQTARNYVMAVFHLGAVPASALIIVAAGLLLGAGFWVGWQKSQDPVFTALRNRYWSWKHRW